MTDPVQGNNPASAQGAQSGQDTSNKTFKEIMRGPEGKKGGFAAFKAFMGEKNYKAWIQSFNSAIVQNIKKDQANEKKVADALKASATGGDMYDV